MRFTLVEMGAWASKLSTGSIFPLVETTARMGPRETAVMWTRSAPRREKMGMRTTAASTPMTTQLQRRRGGDGCELLLFDANLLSFRERQ